MELNLPGVILVLRPHQGRQAAPCSHPPCSHHPPQKAHVAHMRQHHNARRQRHSPGRRRGRVCRHSFHTGVRLGNCAAGQTPPEKDQCGAIGVPQPVVLVDIETKWRGVASASFARPCQKRLVRHIETDKPHGHATRQPADQPPPWSTHPLMQCTHRVAVAKRRNMSNPTLPIRMTKAVPSISSGANQPSDVKPSRRMALRMGCSMPPA